MHLYPEGLAQYMFLLLDVDPHQDALVDFWPNLCLTLPVLQHASWFTLCDNNDKNNYRWSYCSVCIRCFNT